MNLINLPKAEIVIIFYQNKTDFTNVIARAKGSADLIKLFANFDPAGNRENANIKFDGNLLEAEKEVVEHIQKQLDT